MQEIKDVFLPCIYKHYSNNCKISKQIIFFLDPFMTQMSFRTMRDPSIVTKVTVNTKEEEILNTRFTYWDRIVMDAVYTLSVYGQDVFTPEMLMRVISGNPEADASEKKLAVIRDTLDRLSYIKIRVDCTDEMIAKKVIKKGQTYVRETYMLPLEKEEVRSGNHKKIMTAYRLLKKSALYEYAEKVNQFICIPSEILENSHRAVSDSMDAIQIKRYLIMRIEEMKNGTNKMRSDIISYQWYDAKGKRMRGMYPTLGFLEDISDGTRGRKMRSSIHNKVKRILDYYTEIGYIAGYEVIREGKQKIKGVRIKLRKADPE